MLGNFNAARANRIPEPPQAAPPQLNEGLMPNALIVAPQRPPHNRRRFDLSSVVPVDPVAVGRNEEIKEARDSNI